MISIHASLAGGDPRRGGNLRSRQISIHASLAGGDFQQIRGHVPRPISIHASLAGGDILSLPRFASPITFQSTPPSREATKACSGDRAATQDFNPRLPRGRRPLLRLPGSQRRRISIHASLAGGDISLICSPIRNRSFNPRLPRGRRPATTSAETAGTAISIHASLAGGDWLGCAATFAAQVISIHASLAGGDLCRAERTSPWDDFNPRLPRGRRHLLGSPVLRSAIFQSTPPSREATLATADRGRDKFISIHASLAGGDFDLESGNLPRRHFNPRLPRGRRQFSGEIG